MATRPAPKVSAPVDPLVEATVNNALVDVRDALAFIDVVYMIKAKLDKSEIEALAVALEVAAKTVKTASERL